MILVVPHPINGTELTDAMVRKVHMLLHQALDVAVKERLIVQNPTKGTTIPKKAYGEKQVLDNEQLDRFMEIIKDEPYWHDFFYLELMTGLRLGEICGLQWNDINLEDGTLNIKRSVSRSKGVGIVVGETKTGAGVRNIKLPPSVKSLLERKQTEAINEWVFPHYMKPSDPLHPESAYKKLKTFLRHADLPLIRFHDLRHTFATHATKGGVDAKTLSGLLGHTDASFTLDTYTHVTSDMQKNASAIVGRMMQNFIRKE